MIPTQTLKGSQLKSGMHIVGIHTSNGAVVPGNYHVYGTTEDGWIEADRNYEVVTHTPSREGTA